MSTYRSERVQIIVVLDQCCVTATAILLKIKLMVNLLEMTKFISSRGQVIKKLFVRGLLFYYRVLNAVWRFGPRRPERKCPFQRPDKSDVL